jgi:hypothetical protein
MGPASSAADHVAFQRLAPRWGPPVPSQTTWPSRTPMDNGAARNYNEREGESEVFV